MRELTGGAVALYNCANPRYHRWPVDWPPIAAALLSAAEESGAVLATTGNLYGYGPVDGAMTEDTPLAATGRKGRVRARMWRDALAAHEAGRVRATEVRASDYLGGGADSMVSSVVVPAVLAGRTAWVPGRLDVPHSFTYTGDTARALVTVAADERAWGRAWHVPSPPPLTIRSLAGSLARIAGRAVLAAAARVRRGELPVRGTVRARLGAYHRDVRAHGHRPRHRADQNGGRRTGSGVDSPGASTARRSPALLGRPDDHPVRAARRRDGTAAGGVRVGRRRRARAGLLVPAGLPARHGVGDVHLVRRRPGADPRPRRRRTRARGGVPLARRDAGGTAVRVPVCGRPVPAFRRAGTARAGRDRAGRTATCSTSTSRPVSSSGYCRTCGPSGTP